MEDHATPTRLGSDFDADVRLPETVDDPLRPGEVHPARQVAVLLDEGVIRAVAEAHIARGFDLRLIASAAQEVQEAPERTARSWCRSP